MFELSPIGMGIQKDWRILNSRIRFGISYYFVQFLLSVLIFFVNCRLIFLYLCLLYGRLLFLSHLVLGFLVFPLCVQDMNAHYLRFCF
jgi:hypothetical protein